MFKLNENLTADTYFVADLKICKLLLMNNANFPWIILVPKIENAVEITDLALETQIAILEEINLAAKFWQDKFGAKLTKINIATLGNIVRQLHIHVIARFENDAAFPKPVWGFEAHKYGDAEAQKLITEIKTWISVNC